MKVFTTEDEQRKRLVMTVLNTKYRQQNPETRGEAGSWDSASPFFAVQHSRLITTKN